MNIPTGFRRLTGDDITREGDWLMRLGEKEEPLMEMNWGKRVGSISVWSEACYILRKIDSPWISVKERFPTEFGQYAMKIEGNTFLGRWNGYGFITLTTTTPIGKVTHWMHIPDLPEPIIPPITIQEGGSTHELIFNKDGSIKAGCVTIDSETMDKIIVRRGEIKS